MKCFRRFYYQSKKDIFKPTIRNENLHEISNVNGVRVVKLSTSKKSAFKSTMLPHRNIRKFTLLMEKFAISVAIF
jgi:hypothetical protein